MLTAQNFASDSSFSFLPANLNISPLVNTCNTYSILGGKRVIGENNNYNEILQLIQNLPPHYKLTISFLLHKLDNWDGMLSISVQSSNHSKKIYLNYSGISGVNTECGIKNSHHENLSFSINDNFDSELKISYRIDMPKTMFGIRDVYITGLLCNSSCLFCSGPLISDCSQCINNANLTNNCSCNERYYLKRCGETNTTVSCIDKCMQCYSTCATCFNGSDSGCITCISGFHINVTTCIPNYICLSLNKFYDGMTCQNCLSQCATCVSLTRCLTCSSASDYFNSLDGSCSSKCIAGTYPTVSPEIINICKSCHSMCLTCSGPLNTNCNSCQQTSLFLNAGSCVQECPLNMYPNLDKICSPCHTNCKSCYGPSETECLACQNNYLSNGACIANCPPHTFALNNVCEICDVTCLSCNVYFDNCLTCENPYYLSNGSCIADCPQGTYPLSNMCEVCDITCLSCNKNGPDHCLSCQSPYYLSNGACITNCPQGTYPSNNVCEACEITCLTCNGIGSNNCLACDNPFYLSNGACILNCPQGTYPSNNVCKVCDISCLTCNGYGSNNCLSCQESYFLSNGECIANCPQGTYPSNNICEPCDNTCLSCNTNGPDHCLSCQGSFYLSNRECIANCPQSTYPLNNVCEVCDITCSTCNGSGSNDCLSCQAVSRKVLLGNKCICENGTYESNPSLCQSCDVSCLTCTGPGINACLSCDSSNRTFASSNSSCPCKYQTYLDKPTNLCFACDKSCISCVGPTEKNCSSCSSDKILINDTCSCINRTFLDNTINFCKSCDDSCLSCKGSSNLDCTECLDPLKNIFYGECLDNCPNTFYSDINKNCQKCVSNCRICTNVSSCEKCNEGYRLYERICIKNKNIYPSLETIQNPTSFKLIFSDYWQYLMENLGDFLTISINNLPSSNFTYTLNNDKNTSLIILNYKKALNDTSLKLNITIAKSTVTINYDYIMDNKSFLIPLQSYIICTENYYYDSTSKTCKGKTLLKPLLSLKDNHLQISLEFSYSFSKFDVIVKAYSSISIQGLKSKIDYNVTIAFNGDDNFHYELTINTTTPIINRPKLTYCSNIPLEYITQYNLVVTNCSSISLLDWYPLSESVKAVIESTKKQSEVNSFVTGNGVSSVLASSSGIFAYGLMTMEMIYFLKYINVNYPLNALALFENKQKNMVIFFHHTFALEKNSLVLPDIYNYYGVSPYFLNNMGEILCQIGVLLVLSYSIIGFNLVFHNLWFISNLLSTIEGSLVWELMILFILLSIQKLFFYIACSLFFFPFTTQGIINSVAAFVILILLMLWIASMFFHLKKCQNYRLNQGISIFPSASISENLNKKLNSNKTNEKNNILKASQNQKFKKISDDKTIVLSSFLCPDTDKKPNSNTRNEKDTNQKNSSDRFLNKIYYDKDIAIPSFLCPETDKKTNSHTRNEKENNQEKSSGGFFNRITDDKTIVIPSFLCPETDKKTNSNPRNEKDNNRKNSSNSSFKKIPDKNLAIPSFICDETNIDDKNLSNKSNTNLNPIVFKKNAIDISEINTPNEIRTNPANTNMRSILKTLASKIRSCLNISELYRKIKNLNCFYKFFTINNWIIYITKYSSLYTDLKYQTSWQKYYKMFYYFKQILISVLVPTLYNNPVPQMILISLIYGFFLFWTILRNPYDSKLIFVINIVSEFICLSSIISVLILAFLDYYENQDYEFKMNLGWVIVYANVGLLYWVMLTGIIKVIYSLIFKYKEYKMRSKITPN